MSIYCVPVNLRCEKIRGKRISMILQDPKYSLNPLIRIGEQIMEAYRIHYRVSKAEARERTISMLESVHIRDPEHVMRLFPHEISGDGATRDDCNDAHSKT